jgi:transposase
MAKYTSELKLKIVKYVLEEFHSSNEASKEFNIEVSIIKIWVRKYNKHGEKGLLKNNIVYDGEFKKNVIEYMHSNHLSLTETAIHFNLAGVSVVTKWEHIYYEEGPQALYEERRGRSKNMISKPKLSEETEKDLIEEVQQLRMEVAYLKKLNALVQERVKRESPKKHKPSQN